MIIIKAEKREKTGKKAEILKKQGIIPAVLYGPEIKNINIQMDLKEFIKFYQEAGESTLVSLEIGKNKFLVLVHDVKNDPLTGRPIHVDFYQPILTKKVEATVPVIFEGESLAVKDLGGTLVKEIQEVQVKAFPQDLPHEIKVDISGLRTFEEEILVKDLKISDKVEILRGLKEVVAVVAPPEKVEEELEKPIEQGEVIIEKEKKEEEGGEGIEEKEKKEEKVKEKEEEKSKTKDQNAKRKTKI